MDKEQLYHERLSRYVTAMRNEQPDRVPIRPFVAEFTAKYAGMSCQQVVHDYEQAFVAARKCAADFDWDAVVSNMVYVWTGLTQAIGLRYYGIPGIGVPPHMGFQYLEPAENQAFMREDEYDQLIEDPTGFLYNVWLPRVSAEVVAPGQPVNFRHNMSFLKGGMAMMSYFNSFGRQNALLRSESGTVSAIAGIFKAPFDILADKLRGYVGLTMDMFEQPDKVLKACEALMPHLVKVGLTTADPDCRVPIGFWMHRGCVPFISPRQFDSHYWPTLKPIIEEFWRHGHQTLFYAEGNWDHHLDVFATLPAQSIVYHVDRGDLFLAQRKLGEKFCLSGGIPNVLLSYGSTDEVKAHCQKVLDGVAKKSGYILDASAIMQNDTSIENVRVMTDYVREHGVFSARPSSAMSDRPPGRPQPEAPAPNIPKNAGRPPGVCLPWEEKLKELPPLSGDTELSRQVWENVDSLGYTYIWQLLLSF